MKKGFIILLSLLFLFINSGIAVTTHWCGNKLSSIDLFYPTKDSCPCGKKAKKTNCCKDKTAILKANEELARTTQFICKLKISTHQNSLLDFCFIEITTTPKLVSRIYTPYIFYKAKVPIYLLDGVFII